MSQCLTPITMKNKTSAMDIFYNIPATFTFPCGKCPICVENTIKDWSIRCAQETLYHNQNCHITLTISSAQMQKRGNNLLDKEELKTFIANLRNHLRGTGTKIKYYGCGEYGSKNARPHYHIIIFGWKPDKIIKNVHGMRISPEISNLWQYGHHDVSDVHYTTCAYVAGYCSKKMFPPKENSLRGYLNSISPEFKIQSQGIGKQWILDHYKTVMRQNCVHSLNKDYTHIKQRIPRYYLKVIKDLCTVYDGTKKAITYMLFGKNSSYYSPIKFKNEDSTTYHMCSRMRNALKRKIRYSIAYKKFCIARLSFVSDLAKTINLSHVVSCWKRIVAKHKNKSRQ